jgi:hypothetical protein
MNKGELKKNAREDAGDYLLHIADSSDAPGNYSEDDAMYWRECIREIGKRLMGRS